MASYTRQSTFSDGDLITAALFNDEYNQLVAAFDNATGHKHDGTVGEGPVISVLGDAGLATPLNKILIDTTNDHIEFWIDVSGTSEQQLYIANGAIVPATNDDIDLGTNSLQFKDLYINGTANIDNLAADSATLTTADINGGNIDGTVIGATTAAAGTFTTIDASGNVVISGNLTVSGTTTSVNSNEVNIGDNIIVLNSDETGTPSQNAGIEIERGTSTNVSLLWNESNDYWTFGSDNLNFPDGSKAIFGTGGDLEIYHEAGVGSWIKEVGAGDLNIQAHDNLRLQNTASENYLKADSDGAVTLYYDNAAKIATTSSGIDVTGTVTADGLTVDTSTLVVDASNNRVGVGTTSPSAKLNVLGSNYALTSSGKAINGIHVSGDTNGGAGSYGGAISFGTATGASAITSVQGGSDNDLQGLAFIVHNSGTGSVDAVEAMRVQADGHLLVGTTDATTPGVNAKKVVVGSTTNGDRVAYGLNVIDGATNYRAELFLDDSNATYGLRNAASAGAVAFTISQGSTEQLRVDTSGNLLVGKTSAGASTQGIQALASGTLGATSTNASSLTLNRRFSDGTIIGFLKDNVSVGGIGVSSGTIYIDGGTGSTGLYFGSSNIYPRDNGAAVNNAVDIGHGSYKFKDLYLAGTANFGSLSDGTITITGFADEDDMATNSATLLPTQQSVKAYVDSQISSAGGNGISFEDNEKAQFGDSNDLQIYHDGSDSYIADTGTGALNIKASNNLRLQSAGSENYLTATNNGAVAIFYDNSVKLSTTSTGIDVTGTATMDGLTVEGLSNATATTAFSTTANTPNASLIIANSAATTGNGNYKGALGFAKAGTSPQIRSAIVGKQTATSSNVQGLAFLVHPNSVAGSLTEALLIKANNDIIFYDDTGTSENMVWDASEDRLTFVDNAKATFGTGNDLQIFHDGSNSYISENGTGNLILKGGGQILLKSPADENMIVATGNGAVGLYYDNVAKLQTTSDGIDVTGTVVSDGLTVDGLNSSVLRFNVGGTAGLDAYSSGAYPSIYVSKSSAGSAPFDSIGNLIIQSRADTFGRSINFVTGATTSANLRLNISGSGDISFYDDTGTTQGLFWDASAESLGIGITSPAAKLEISTTDGVESLRINSSDIQVTEGELIGEILFTSNDATLNADRKVLAGIKTFAAENFAGANANEASLQFFTANSNDLRNSATPSPRMTINEDGNVGIGTSSPDNTLMVQGASSTGASSTGNVALFEGPSGTNGLKIFIDDTENAAGLQTIASDDLLLNPHGGSVGIGNTSPLAQFHVSTTGQAISRFSGSDATLVVRNAVSNELDLNVAGSGDDLTFSLAGSEKARINWGGNFGVGTSSPNNKLTVSGASDGINIVGTNSFVRWNSGNMMIRDEGSYAMGFHTYDGSTGQIERMRITSAGNIGVGTSSPQTALDVRGELTLANTSATLGAESVISAVNFYNTDGSGTGPNNAAIIKALAKTSTGAGGFLTFHTSDGTETEGSDAPEVMRIHHNGNVGIGTTLPDKKLDVLGDIRSIDSSSNQHQLRPTQIISYATDAILNAQSTGDDVRLNTQGTTRLIATAEGNVGIGTSSPADELHVNGSGDTAIRVTTSSTSLEPKLVFVDGSGDYASLEKVNRDIKIKAFNTDVAYFTNDGRLGVGTSSPDSPLHVQQSTTGTHQIHIKNSHATGSGSSRVKLSNASDTNSNGFQIINNANDGVVNLLNYKQTALAFWTNATERARIDSSGNFLVGTTSNGISSEGVVLRERGDVRAVRSGGTAGVFNRLTSDGGVIAFQKDGTTVGSISVAAGTIRVNGTDGSGLYFANASVFPSADNVKDLGVSSNRYKDLYLSGGHMNGAADSFTFVSGGNASNAGANILLYGQSHSGSANTTVFRASGTESARIDSSGRLLIGQTSSNGDKLEVQGNANVYAARLNGSTTGGQSYGLRVRAGSNSSDVGLLVENTSGTDLFKVRGDGNVGINTSSPSSKLHIVNNATDDTVLLESTEDSSSAAPVLTFKRNSSSPADADYLGQLKFKGENDADQEVVYAKITAKISDASDGTEDGLIEFANKKAGSNVITARLTSETFKLLNGTDLEVNGSITADGNITAYSDKRLKDNIETLNGSKVLDMRGVSYVKDGKKGSGVIAQEIEKIAPELVHTAKDEMGTKSVAYGNLVGYLIEAIKDQQEQINELKGKLNDITG